MTTEWNWDASGSIFPVSPPKIGTLLGFIVYQVYLNEDEDDVTRKNLPDVEVVILQGAVGCHPGCVSALPGLGSGE